jgi:hypothetical protein
MTRRHLLASFLFALVSMAAFPAVARPAGKSGPLEVTYYYLPG